MATQTSAVTADERLRMPNDGARYDTETRPDRDEPRDIAQRSVRAERLGVVYAAETGFLLTSAPDTVRVPDVAFVAS